MEYQSVKSAIQQRLPEVFAVFAPMDDRYVLAIQQHHKIVTQRDKYNPDYIARDRQETKKAIKEMKLEYLTKAKAVIAKIKEAYTETPKKKEPGSAEDQMAMQLERNNKLLIWSAQLPAASVDVLKELWVQHKDDEDFMTLLNVEFMKRKGNPDALNLKAKIENPVDNGNFAELDKVEKGLTFICNNDFYPAGLKGLENVSYRTVDTDLNLYPILNGPTYRPVFKLPA